MSGILKVSQGVLAGLVLLATAAFGQAEPPRVMASNGAVVTLPEITGLSCLQMAEVLYLLDLSQYRGPEALPRDHPDWEIFEYEDRLTQRHYYACMLPASQLQDPGAAFSSGFGSQ